MSCFSYGCPHSADGVDGVGGEPLLGVDRKCPAGWCADSWLLCLGVLVMVVVVIMLGLVFPKPWPLNFCPCSPSHPFVQKVCGGGVHSCFQVEQLLQAK